VGVVAVAPLAFLQEVEDAYTDDVDGRVMLHDVSWDRYEALLAFVGEDFPSLHVTYLEGALELLTTSHFHEAIKKMLARLVEAYAVEARLNLNGYGQTTFRKRARRRGAEPDECYSLGRLHKVPDIAVEVVWTSGGLDKLDVYAGLEVPEVWMWEDHVLTVHALGVRGYRKVKRSRFLPGLDPALLGRYLERPDQTKAVIDFLDAVRMGETPKPPLKALRKK
jgi:Uma2 family endonuclease